MGYEDLNLARSMTLNDPPSRTDDHPCGDTNPMKTGQTGDTNPSDSGGSVRNRQENGDDPHAGVPEDLSVVREYRRFKSLNFIYLSQQRNSFALLSR